MKNMTNSKCRKLGKAQLIKAFKELHLKDGLGDEEVGAEDFSYWYNKARDGMIGNYLIYEVIASDAARRADDLVVGREFYAQIDVFSVKSFESKQLYDFLVHLEERLTAAGFEVDAQGEDYEPDTRLYHQAYFISKLFF